MISLMFITCLICWPLAAPPSSSMVIFATEEIKPYETLWNATCKVESNFNPYAVGDKHLKQHSFGIAQIRKTRLDDFYKQTGIRYSVTDMYDTVKSKQVFMHYASQHHPSDIRGIVSSWNGGPNWRQKKSTYQYYLKIKANL